MQYTIYNRYITRVNRRTVRKGEELVPWFLHPLVRSMIFKMSRRVEGEEDL